MHRRQNAPPLQPLHRVVRMQEQNFPANVPFSPPLFDSPLKMQAVHEEGFGLEHDKENFVAQNISADISKRLFTSPSSKSPLAQSPQIPFEYTPEAWFPRSTKIPERLRSKGIRSLREWQVKALKTAMGKPEGQVQHNLIIWAPTAAGKSLVAQALLWNHSLQFPRGDPKISFMVVPYVALSNEFVASWRKLFQDEIHVSNKFRTDAFDDVSCHRLIITTPEAANTLLDNEIIAAKRYDKLAFVFVDECHTVSRKERGPILEAFLSKIIYLSMHHSKSIRICAMSATLNQVGVESLQKWYNSLDAILHGCKKGKYKFECPPLRPPTTLTLCHDNHGISPNVRCYIVNMDKKLVRIRQGEKELNLCEISQHERDRIPNFTKCGGVNDSLTAILETNLEAPTLVFCGRRDDTKKYACAHAEALRQLNVPVSHRTRSRRSHILQKLEQFNVKDAWMVMTGVAFHHSGLHKEIRRVLESALRDSVLNILFTTEGLSAGVNFDTVSRIILIGNMMSLTSETYIQSAGRCGRSDNVKNPECWLLATNEKMINKALQPFSLEPHLIPKQLLPQNKILDAPDIQSLLRLFVELIGSGLISNTSQFSCFFRCTLSKERYEANSSSIKRIASLFRDKNFIASEKQNFNVLIDGCAAFHSRQTPAHFLKRKEEFLALKSKPFFLCDAFFIHLMMQNTRLFRIPESVHIDLTPVEQAQMSCIIDVNLFDVRPIHPSVLRAWTTLAIMDAINEKSFAEISTRFGCGDGDVQEMLKHAQQEASMCLAMCDTLREEDNFWNDMYNLLKPRLRRIVELCKPEILPLLELNSNELTPYIDVRMARAFFQAGIKTIPGLAAKSTQEIRSILEQNQYGDDDTDLTQVCIRLKDRVHESLHNTPSLELSTGRSPDFGLGHKRKRLFDSPIETQPTHKRVKQANVTCRIVFENLLWNPRVVSCTWFEESRLVKETTFDLNMQNDRQAFEHIITDNSILKQWMGVQWTLKELLEVHYVTVKNVYDPVMAFFLMNPHLRDLRLNEFKKTNKAIEVLDKEFLNWVQVLGKIRTRYHMNAAASVHDLCDRILTEWEEFKSSNSLENHSQKMLHKQYVNESYMAVLCAEMECYGLNFDAANFEQLQRDANKEMEESVKKICELYQSETRKPLRWTYDEEGMYSLQTKEALVHFLCPSDPCSEAAKQCLNKKMLKECSKPIASHILRFQRAQYVKKRCSCVFKRSFSDTNQKRIYSQWTVLANPNLRFTSRTPNIQNIPKDQSGSRMGMRSLFGAREGCVLIGADYNHIELRIAAYLAQDDELTERLSKEDMFADMAIELGHDREEIKRLVYSVLYGRSRKTVDEEIDNVEVSIKFWKVFEKLLEYRTSQQKKLVESRFIRTALLHRTIQIGANARQVELKQALRTAWNYHVSGTASEIVREAMRKLHKTIQIESAMLHSQDPDYKYPVALLVVQLHDELIYEVERSFENRFIGILNDTMSRLVNGWRLPVQIKKGENWGNMSVVDISHCLSPL